MHSSAIGFENLLDRCLVAIQEQGKTVEDCLALYPDERAQLEPLLRLATRLSGAQTLKAPPEFRRTSPVRVRNMVAARPRPVERAAAGRSLLDPLAQKLSALLRTVKKSPAMLLTSLVLALLLFVGSGAVYVSAQALPGDLLYPVKMSVEDLRLAVSPDEMSAARLRLAFAGRRLGEAEALLKTNRVRDVERALAGYTDQVRATLSLLGEGSPLAPGEQVVLAGLLVRNLTQHEARILGRVDRVSRDLRPAMELALMSSQRGLERALEVGGEPQPPATPVPTFAVTATASPEPPTVTPVPTSSATLTSSPTPSTTATPVVATATPLPELLIPSWTPRPRLPSRTPVPLSTPWPVPTWWPPECPVPPDWPEEWPPDCPLPTAWPTGWPLPTAWPTQFPTLPALETPILPTPSFSSPPPMPTAWPSVFPQSTPEPWPTFPTWPTP